MKKTWNIAIACQIFHELDRHAIRGAVSYGAAHEGFHFHDIRFVEDEEVPAKLREHDYDGAIINMMHFVFEPIAEEFPAIPLVNIGIDKLSEEIPSVSGVRGEGSRLLLAHLRGQGYQRFAFITVQPLEEQNPALDNVRLLLSEEELPLAAWCLPALDINAFEEELLDPLTEWLQEIVDPECRTAIITCDGKQAVYVREACRRLELAVPDCVGIAAYGDTRPCITSSPAITAIEVPSYEFGYAAMHLLHQMFLGKKPPAELVEIPGGRVIVRGSTAPPDVFRDEIEAAKEFLEKNFTRQITVDDCRAHLGNVAHTSFYRSFKQQVGLPPGEYLRNLKVNQAKELLIGTQFSVSRVAELCGFSSHKQFDNTFKLVVGKSPSQYRQSMAGGSKKRRTKEVGG